MESKLYNILVCGNRKYDDYDKVESVLNKYNINLIIHGGATGADNLADKYANNNSIKTKVFPADWSIGRKAGPIRNKLMIEYLSNINGNKLVIYFDNSGPGTKGMIKLAKSYNIEVIQGD